MTPVATPSTHVESVMRDTVVAVEPSASLHEAALALKVAGVGSLAVMDGAEVRGIVTERDVVRAIADRADPAATTVAEVMSTGPRYVTLGDHVETALEVMLEAGIRHLPVVEEGELVGIVSIRDLAGALVPPRSR